MICVSSLSVHPENLTIYAGMYIKLMADIRFVDERGDRIYWYSDNSNIVEVNPNTGEICGKSVGKTKVWAVSVADNTKTDCCTIEVKPKFIQIESLVISSGDVTLNVGESMQIIADIYPKSVTNDTLCWTSCDEHVVKVDSDGVITALSAGEALILVRATDGSRMQDYCRVTVQN